MRLIQMALNVCVLLMERPIKPRITVGDLVDIVVANNDMKLLSWVTIIDPNHDFSKAVKTACQNGNIDLLGRILAVFDPKFLTLEMLMDAHCNGHVEILKMLFAYGISFTEDDRKICQDLGYEQIMEAADATTRQPVIIERPIEPIFTIAYTARCLVFSDDIEYLQYMLDLDPNADFKEAVNACCLHGRAEALHKIMEVYDPALLTQEMMSMACYGGHKEVVNILIRYGLTLGNIDKQIMQSS